MVLEQLIWIKTKEKKEKKKNTSLDHLLIEHIFIPFLNHTQLGWKEDRCLGTSVFQFEVRLIFIELFEPCVPTAESHAFVGRFFSFNINV